MNKHTTSLPRFCRTETDVTDDQYGPINTESQQETSWWVTDRFSVPCTEVGFSCDLISAQGGRILKQTKTLPDGQTWLRRSGLNMAIILHLSVCIGPDVASLHFGDSMASVNYTNAPAWLPHPPNPPPKVKPQHRLIAHGNKCSVRRVILMAQMPCHAHMVQLMMMITEPRFGMNSSGALLTKT